MNDPAAASACGRREASRRSRREAILDVAARSFLEQGYAATTMSAIAALGGSKGTLWSYFPSKEELFAAVLDRMIDAFQLELVPILNPTDPVGTALDKFCRRFLRKITQADALALYRLVVGEANRFPEPGRIFYARGPGRTHERLSAYLAGAMERGLLRHSDPDAAALQLTGLCLAGCHMQLVMGVIDEVTDTMIEHDCDRTLAMFLRAYAP
jgi:TetR/AcrR family transcriptional regulator, mexJK operon transcriptional repressor